MFTLAFSLWLQVLCSPKSPKCPTRTFWLKREAVKFLRFETATPSSDFLHITQWPRRWNQASQSLMSRTDRFWRVRPSKWTCQVQTWPLSMRRWIRPLPSSAPMRRGAWDPHLGGGATCCAGGPHAAAASEVRLTTGAGTLLVFWLTGGEAPEVASATALPPDNPMTQAAELPADALMASAAETRVRAARSECGRA